MYFHDFLIQELQTYIPQDIHNLFDSSNKYKEYSVKKYWKFNEFYSLKYCNDMEIYIEDKKTISHFSSFCSRLGYKPKPSGKTFYEYINSKIDTQTQLSIKIHDKTIDNINKLGKVHTLEITECKTNIWNYISSGKTNIWDISELGNLNSLHLIPKIYRYQIRHNQFTLIGIKNLGNLHTLDLSYTEVSAKDVIHLGNVHTPEPTNP